MTAGAVRAPAIVPLRPPQVGKPKSSIDTTTKIELSCDTPNVDIFFTINGAKPEPFQTIGGDRNTYRYQSPFTLPSGKRTVKAIAVSKDTKRESNVVTKSFEIEYIKGEEQPYKEETDNYGFMEELREDRKEGNRKAARSYIRRLLKNPDAWGESTIENEPTSTRRSRVNFADDIDGFKPTGGRFSETRVSSRSMKDARKMDYEMSGTLSGLNLESSEIERRRAIPPPPNNATQAMRLQRETDFLKCLYCLAPRPSDPFSRFCNNCGNTVPPLPQTRLPPPESGQLGMCVHCRSTVPMNVPTCLVCEAPMPPQNQPQASLRLQERIVCRTCGSANPSNLDSCLTCEARLPLDASAVTSVALPQQLSPPTPMLASLPAPNTSIAPGGMNQSLGLLACNKCGRQNNPDARYCDWCGAKPCPPMIGGSTGAGGDMQSTGSSMTHLVCGQCSAHNQRYAKFCGQCGIVLEPPPRHAATAGLATVTAPNQWLPITLPLGGGVSTATGNPAVAGYLWRRGVPCDASTQTVGLFYPSTAEIKKREMEEEEKSRTDRERKDKAPMLTVVSPGKGYWRKQIDHIIAHLKAHANNNVEFRALIGEPRMGKLMTTDVHEDGYELNLSLTFALKDYKDPYRGQALGVSQYLSSVTKGRGESIDSFRSDETASIGSYTAKRSKATKKKQPKKKPQKKKQNEEESVSNRALIREVGKNGEGRSREILQLIEEGADPEVTNKDNIPVIILAVRNKHKDAIPALVQSKPEVINQKGPDKGNTALHEAVLMKMDGEEMVDVVLGCGAKVNQKNDRNDSAYDLAVKLNNEAAIKKLASKLGQDSLNRMVQAKYTDDDDDDV